MDLFNMASQNADNLERSYCLLKNRCMDQDELDILSEFVRSVKDEWTVSINMMPSVLNYFLIAGRYMNVYELKKESSKHIKGAEVSVELAIKKHLGDYYESRTRFDRTFEDGEKFKYGALNIGGLGLRKFGEYCVVMNQRQLRTHMSLVFIKEDSLCYVKGDHVDIERLSQEISDKGSVHFLAALKHEYTIKTILPDEWTSLICCDGCYNEAVTMDDISNKHVESIRVSKNYYDFISDLLYKDFISEISDEEKTLLYDFKIMEEVLKKEGIKLEVIEQ